MQKKGFTLVELMVVVIILGLVASVVIPLLTKDPNEPEKQMGTFEITNLPGAAQWQSMAGYQIKALYKDPNDGYVPYLSIALSEVRHSWLRENETIIAVIPCKYDKSGDLQGIWVATMR